MKNNKNIYDLVDEVVNCLGKDKRFYVVTNNKIEVLNFKDFEYICCDTEDYKWKISSNSLIKELDIRDIIFDVDIAISKFKGFIVGNGEER